MNLKRVARRLSKGSFKRNCCSWRIRGCFVWKKCRDLTPLSTLTPYLSVDKKSSLLFFSEVCGGRARRHDTKSAALASAVSSCVSATETRYFPPVTTSRANTAVVVLGQPSLPMVRTTTKKTPHPSPHVLSSNPAPTHRKYASSSSAACFACPGFSGELLRDGICPSRA